MQAIRIFDRLLPEDVVRAVYKGLDYGKNGSVYILYPSKTMIEHSSMGEQILFFAHILSALGLEKLGWIPDKVSPNVVFIFTLAVLITLLWTTYIVCQIFSAFISLCT